MMALVILAVIANFASAANLRSNSFAGITTGTGLGEERRVRRPLRRSNYQRYAGYSLLGSSRNMRK